MSQAKQKNAGKLFSAKVQLTEKQQELAGKEDVTEEDWECARQTALLHPSVRAHALESQYFLPKLKRKSLIGIA